MVHIVHIHRLISNKKSKWDISWFYVVSFAQCAPVRGEERGQREGREGGKYAFMCGHRLQSLKTATREIPSNRFSPAAVLPIYSSYNSMVLSLDDCAMPMQYLPFGFTFCELWFHD